MILQAQVEGHHSLEKVATLPMVRSFKLDHFGPLPQQITISHVDVAAPLSPSPRIPLPVVSEHASSAVCLLALWAEGRKGLQHAAAGTYGRSLVDHPGVARRARVRLVCTETSLRRMTFLRGSKDCIFGMLVRGKAGRAGCETPIGQIRSICIYRSMK